MGVVLCSGLMGGLIGGILVGIWWSVTGLFGFHCPPVDKAIAPMSLMGLLGLCFGIFVEVACAVVERPGPDL